MTVRQDQIADLVVIGADTREIAATLGVKQGAIKQHLTKMFIKYGINGPRRNKRVLLAVKLYRERKNENKENKES